MNSISRLALMYVRIAIKMSPSNYSMSSGKISEILWQSGDLKSDQWVRVFILEPLALLQSSSCFALKWHGRGEPHTGRGNCQHLKSS